MLLLPSPEREKVLVRRVAGSRVTKIHSSTSSRAASTVANRTAKCEQAETLQHGDKTRLVERSACTMELVSSMYLLSIFVFFGDLTRTGFFRLECIGS